MKKNIKNKSKTLDRLIKEAKSFKPDNSQEVIKLLKKQLKIAEDRLKKESKPISSFDRERDELNQKINTLLVERARLGTQVEELEKERLKIIKAKEELVTESRNYKERAEYLRAELDKVQNASIEADRDVQEYEPDDDEVFVEALSNGSARIALGNKVRDILNKYKKIRGGSLTSITIQYYNTIWETGGNRLRIPGEAESVSWLFDKALLDKGSVIRVPYNNDNPVEVNNLKLWITNNLEKVMKYISREVALGSLQNRSF